MRELTAAPWAALAYFFCARRGAAQSGTKTLERPSTFLGREADRAASLDENHFRDHA